MRSNKRSVGSWIQTTIHTGSNRASRQWRARPSTLIPDRQAVRFATRPDPPPHAHHSGPLPRYPTWANGGSSPDLVEIAATLTLEGRVHSSRFEQDAEEIHSVMGLGTGLRYDCHWSGRGPQTHRKKRFPGRPQEPSIPPSIWRINHRAVRWVNDASRRRRLFGGVCS